MFNSDYCLEHCLKEPIIVKGITTPLSEFRPMITLVGGVTFSRVATKTRRHDVKVVGTITVYELKTILKAFATQCSEESLSERISDEDIRRKIPAELRDLTYAFRKTLTEKLPPHRS